jgi:hypothetical protein
VGPLVLAALGALALLSGAIILRSFGTGYRVGRLLAAVPRVSVAEATAIATAGDRRYVRIDGRIDSESEFEDEHHRPLVVRRTSLSWRPSNAQGAWRSIAADTQAVPFVVREGMDEIAVGTDALAEGLVVVPRESRGRVADLGDRMPEGVDPDAEARLVVEQVSSVEHASVLGLPQRLPDGRIGMGPGLGRPLVLTTLEHDEAMRVLAGGAIGRSRLAASLLAAGAILIGVAALWWLLDAVSGGTAVALAASPEPTLRPGADTRSSGQGPGLVGEPLLAVLGVLGIGLASVVATLAYLRLGAAGAPDRARRADGAARTPGDSSPTRR